MRPGLMSCSAAAWAVLSVLRMLCQGSESPVGFVC